MLKEYSLEEQFCMIEQIEQKSKLDKTDLKTLQMLSSSLDHEIRLRVAQILVDTGEDQACQILLTLSEDTDELVRANACDSLGIFSNMTVRRHLYNIAIHDKSSLVRMYAVLSLGDIIINGQLDDKKTGVKKLVCALKREKTIRVKLAYAQTLYLLGCDEYFDFLAEQVDNKRYQNRMLAIKALCRIINPSTKQRIVEILRKRERVEKAYAVSDLLERELANLTS